MVAMLYRINKLAASGMVTTIDIRQANGNTAPASALNSIIFAIGACR